MLLFTLMTVGVVILIRYSMGIWKPRATYIQKLYVAGIGRQHGAVGYTLVRILQLSMSNLN